MTTPLLLHTAQIAAVANENPQGRLRSALKLRIPMMTISCHSSVKLNVLEKLLPYTPDVDVKLGLPLRNAYIRFQCMTSPQVGRP
jgi:hypothetical protein